MQDQSSRQHRRGAVRPIVISSLMLLALVVVVATVLNRGEMPQESRPIGSPVESSGESSGDSVAAEELRPQVAAFCGDCHATPSPAGFPRAAWHEEVKQGYDFYYDSGRSDLSPPDFDRVVAWYRSQAPEEIVIPRPVEVETPNKLRFRVAAIAASREGQDSLPAVSFVKSCILSPGDTPVLLWCDMRSGEVRAADPLRERPAARLIGKLRHPAHAEPCDLDGDGRVDLVVAELGSFLPSDHADGKVVWLQQQASDVWEPIVIQEGLGRVADVQPGDFDADGDVDLVVAEFGWRKTGGIFLLENLGNTAGTPKFRKRDLDSRHGTIHVPTSDLDGDGRLDFVALISQEHEKVLAFFNDGAGGFRKEPIFSANEPSFGSSGIQLVDLDRDGDVDVLYTNGDTFDSFYPKPYHSIRWLENRGAFPFEDHLLACMPGVHRALACDLDGDGDLDIAACALLPDRQFGRQTPTDFDSLLWLEQIEPGKFARHSLERGTCQHAVLEVGDFDGDGDIDLAVGRFTEQGRFPSLELWWNLRINAEKSK